MLFLTNKANQEETRDKRLISDDRISYINRANQIDLALRFVSCVDTQQDTR